VFVIYRHTQRGTTMVAGLLLSASCAVFGIYWVWSQAPSAVAWPVATDLLGVMAVMGAAAWYFSSMTIEVTEDELRWHFGPGIYFKVPRADIAGAGVVGHPLLWGYGIRWRGPNRWVHIIAGRNAVEVRLKDGGWRHLGTDDPQGLIAALTSAQS
jgi:hypothetical protein